MLKVIPLAAMASATVTLGDVEARAYELKSSKKYLLLITQDIPLETARQMRTLLLSRGIDATIVAGTIADLSIYELE